MTGRASSNACSYFTHDSAGSRDPFDCQGIFDQLGSQSVPRLLYFLLAAFLPYLAANECRYVPHYHARLQLRKHDVCMLLGRCSWYRPLMHLLVILCDTHQLLNEQVIYKAN